MVFSYACVLDMFDEKRGTVFLGGAALSLPLPTERLNQVLPFFFFLFENPSKLKKGPCEHVLVVMMMNPLEAGSLPGEE